MGASTLSTMVWDAHDVNMPRSIHKLNTYASCKWVKVDLPQNEWVGAAGTPTLAAQATGKPYSWTMEDTTPDAITTLVDLPNNIDRTEPIKFQILFSMETTGNKNPDFSIVYKAFAPGDDHAAADTALGTTIPVTTDGAANDEGMLRQTYVGEIAGRILESDEEILFLTLAIDDDDSTASKTEVWSVRYWYARLLL